MTLFIARLPLEVAGEDFKEAATNALSHEADITKVHEWLGHANVSTTRLYDRRKTLPKDSPMFRIRY
jgi:integrase/recombinase XerD